MKQIIMAAMLVLAAVCSYAQEGKVEKRDYTLRTEGTESMTGEVKTFDAADLTRTNSRLVIVDESGKTVEFEVRPSAAIYSSADGSLLTSYDLYPGLKVKVDYIKDEDGALKAVGVKALSKNEPAQVKEETQVEQKSMVSPEPPKSDEDIK